MEYAHEEMANRPLYKQVAVPSKYTVNISPDLYLRIEMST